jgi:hypothetical protein
MTGRIKEVEFTPTLTAGAYTANDVLFETMELKGVLRPGRFSRIVAAQVIDKDDQAVGLELVFFRRNVALGTLNGAVAITDANAEYIGCIIEMDDYVDLIGSQYGIAESISGAHQGLHSASWSFISNDGNDTPAESVWVAGITRGTPTHTVNGLVFHIYVEEMH